MASNLDLRDLDLEKRQKSEDFELHVRNENGAECREDCEPQASDSLLNEQTSHSNGGTATNGLTTHQAQKNTFQLFFQNGFFQRIKEELNQTVWKKCKVWMFIPLICVVIVVVVIVSMAVCSALHKDEDESYDSLLFTVPQRFNGSFQLSSKLLSDEAQVLEDLQHKLDDLYRSSPALGRYFLEVETLRNKTSDILYSLTFKLPEDGLEELRNFTLSREMVQNVLRQYLYDQDPDDSGGMFIDPVSLRMSTAY
ncbi:TPA-induced transmembrane protein isoform X2 [Kryptolebias marmoratus]|uniref:TPA-induced transmembrane protein isoform X2 n=1 Tax=Kryptolebias marmoratus TaxID=37003 RepID=UPI0007F872A7|nr:TPA-induced transmembrane protein isoform X2 [Kryptolebias marmoratus]